MKKAIVALVIIFAVLTFSAGYCDEAANKVCQLREKIIQIQNKGEFGIRDLTVCSEIGVYGQYTPMEPVVSSGEEFLVYFEPENLYTKKEGGMYKTNMSQDVQILSPDGNKVLFEKKQFLVSRIESRKPVSEVFVKNKFQLTAPSGKYLYNVILYDNNRGVKVEKYIPIRIK